MRTDDVLCITDKVADESGNVKIILRFEGKSFKTEISEPTVSKSNHYK